VLGKLQEVLVRETATLTEDRWNQDIDRFLNLDHRCRLCREPKSVETKVHILSECSKIASLRLKFNESIKDLDAKIYSKLMSLPAQGQVYWILIGGRRFLKSLKSRLRQCHKTFW